MSSRAATQVFQMVEEQIATGQLKDGEKLDEATLAERFNVSRTPVREALLQLVGSGLARQIPKRGCFVKSPSLREMIEMFEVMAELEGMCARLAARRMTEDQLNLLKKANVGCEQAITDGDSDLYYDKNVDFHECIYDACGNQFLANEARRLRRRLRSFRRLQLRVRGRMSQSLSEHSEIINAIENGLAEQAEIISRQHVMIQGERFNDLLAHMEPTP
ncbi:GntR family transcriptional regulator [Litorivicinus sp.]|mgnify:CR=1 FL=1|jgi:DNA-binding GntR family transcriptional regulator|nr:GntR family transcriptional regulator [Litorivicinus sp.]MDB9862202.1 GntR family transcriptional regulator [Litorivicinus sp.]MDC1208665.1 GntR family transcriptional regulator [Litorivicinus sp.]MDC1239779.1 GntR family transcriptional regulator [Litorivicinus sp.]MDC1466489.1 GntR family transcriptional regulator [Litorivicinus sp.]|tara:strand:+ start:372 stop:1025 length:654 start_codon:yes stop_codon:yes gene_type:complete